MQLGHGEQMIPVGVAGWSYADWAGRVYPRSKPASFSHLAYLSRYIDCIELNSSFYAYPVARNCESWVRQLDGINLPFLVKLHRDFTHAHEPWQSFGHFDQHVTAFLEGLEPLRVAQRLRLLLVQFPFSFVRNLANRKRLDQIVSAFTSENLVVELRHRSWFEPEVLARFAARSISVATIDLPAASGHPPQLHSVPTSTGPIGYLRLHGRNSEHWFRAESTRNERYDYLYSPQELNYLAATACSLKKNHDEVFVVANNHFEGQAVANALQLRARLGPAEPKPKAPVILREAFPLLCAETEPDGPAQLF